MRCKQSPLPLWTTVSHMALQALPASLLTLVDLLKSPSSARYPEHLFMMVSSTRMVQTGLRSPGGPEPTDLLLIS